MKKERDFSLDLLRALACIMVVGVHLQLRFNMPGPVGTFFEKGSTGVLFFFVLSGYLVYGSLDREYERAGSAKKGLMSFWLKRLIHLLPLYFLVILYYFILYAATQAVPEDTTGLYWLRYIFLINLWVPTTEFFWTNLGAVWSVSVFVFFYLIAPFYHKLVQNHLLAWLGTAASYVIFSISKSEAAFGMPYKYLFYFFLGILGYIAVRDSKKFEAAAVLFLILLLCFLTGIGTSVAPALLAVLFIIAAGGVKRDSLQNSFFGRIITGISTTSYSIYLVHVAVLLTLDIVMPGQGPVYLILFVLLTVPLTAVAYIFVEKKFTRFIGSLL